MNTDEADVLEESLTSLLAACDEALAAGTEGTPLPGTGVAPELRPRFEENLACLHRLQKLRPRPRWFAATSLADPGLTKLGRFRIRRELGRGGFGIVFLAHDPVLGREVALKVPRADALVTPELRARFHQEARAAATLDHPNVVPVYEAGEIGPVCYIASAYCPGITLAQWLKERSEPVPVHVAAGLTLTLATAMQHAHSRGVLHRDLKPTNVLLQTKDEGGRMKDEGHVSSSAGSSFILPPSSFVLPPSSFIPKITDFGLAKLLEGEPGVSALDCQTHSGAIVGTASYMAPEQAAGKTREIGTAADIYALGAILYEMVTGRPPFQAESVLATLEQVRTQEPAPLRRLRPQTPRDLETICLKCLDKQPGKRYASADGFAEDLKRFLAGEPVLARPIGAWERGVRWARRQPAAAALAGVSLLAALVLLTVLAVSNFQIAQKQQETDRALQRETAANDELTRTLDRERRTLYVNGLALAQVELASGNVGEADELLDDCPTQFRGWEWRHLKRLGHGNLVLRGHTDEIHAITFSPDSRRLASTGIDRTVRIWDTKTGVVLHTLRRHTGGAVKSVAFSPDGKRVASASQDRTVKIWDVVTGDEVRTLVGHTDLVAGVTFSPDGLHLVSGGADKTIRVWDAATGGELHTLKGHTDRVAAVAYSPDGQRLVSGSWDRTIKIWDTANWTELCTLRGHTEAVTGIAFSFDSRRIASASVDETVRVWDAIQGELVHTLDGHTGGAQSVTFSPDGQRLASCSTDQTVKIWDVTTGQAMLNLRAHASPLLSVSFSPDGQRLAAAGFDQTIRVWDAAPLAEKSGWAALTLRGHKGLVTGVGFSPDGRRLVSAGGDRTIRIWDATDGQEIRTLSGHTDWVKSVAFSHDGRRLASAGGARGKPELKIWDALDGGEIRTLDGHIDMVTGVTYSPDGRFLASASMDATVKIWDADTGQELRTLRGHTDYVWYVAFSANSQHVASASKDGTVRVWDAATGEELRSLGGMKTGWGIGFRPDGQRVAFPGPDFGITVRDVATGEEVLTLQGHQDLVDSVAFSPDGRFLAAGYQDKTVKLWDANTGKELTAFRGHTGAICSLAFSPDGRRLASASGHLGRGQVLVWDLNAWRE